MRSRKVGLFTALSAVLLSYSAASSAIELDDPLESTIGVVNGDLLDGRGRGIAGGLLNNGELPVAGRVLDGDLLGGDLLGGDLLDVDDVIGGGNLPVVGGLPIVGNLLGGNDLPILGDLLDQ